MDWAGLARRIAAAYVLGLATAQSAPLFNRLTTDDGLPSNEVYETAVDRSGFLWIATRDGLARYDGVGFKVYRHDPADPESLPGNETQTVFVDREDRVWVGTVDGGLSVLDQQRHGFHHYRHDPGDPRSLSGTDVWAIGEDAHGAIWAGTYGGGLNRLDPVSGRIEVLRHRDGDAKTLAADDVVALHIDRNGWLWAGTSAGVTVLRISDRAAAPAGGDVRQFLAGELVPSVRDDGSGEVWIGTRDALYRTHSSDAGPAEPQALSLPLESPRVRSVARDSGGTLWIATLRGLIRIDPSGEARTQTFQPGLAFGLPSNRLMHAQRDREGNLWLSLLGAGIAQLGPQWRNFQVLRPDEAVVDGSGGSYTPVVAACPDGGVWTTEPSGALLRFDADGAYVRRHPVPATTAPEAVRRDWSLLCTSDGALWLGQRAGVWRYDPGTGRVDRWNAVADRADALAPGVVDLMVEDHDAVWVTVLGIALFHIDAGTRAVRRYAADELGPRSREIEQLLRDADGRLWVAGTDGLDRYDAESARFVPITGAPAGRIDAMAFAADGRLWLHTLEQLVRYRSSGTQLEVEARVLPTDGLPVAALAGMSVAADGQLWLVGPRGLWRYDPTARRFRSYGRADGLATSEFGTHPPTLKADGTLLLPSALGVVAFDPTSLRDNPIAPNVVFDAVSVQRADARVALDGTLPLRLDYHDRDLRVSARALSLAAPSTNRYRFRLTGFDDDWVETGTRGEREFSQLPAGKYSLAVAASNNSGVWAESSQVLSLSVAPPPWRSLPAYAIYAIALGLMAWQSLRAYRQRLERRHTLALAQELRHAAERQSQAKSDFLADMGHEIRTPMSGLLGMTELLLRSDLSPKQRGYAHTVRRSGEHLLKLINDLLDLSRIEAGKLELEPGACDVHALVRDVIALEAPLATEQGLLLRSTIADDVPQWVHADAMRLKEVLLNLINNALKFTTHGSVSVHLRRDPRTLDALEFAVVDTGPGMSADTVARLFGRFEQGAAEPGRRRGGSGLGLAISRRLVELMGGSIAVDSVPGDGSTFRVAVALLPVAAGTGAVAPQVQASRPRLRVLVVEDDATTRTVLVELLAALGHKVDSGINGLDALRQLGEFRYDAALFDLDLPGVDGLKLMRMVRKRELDGGPRLYSIAITARSGSDAQAQCHEAGFDDFLRKPLSGEQLQSALDSAINSALRRSGGPQ